MAEKFTNNFSTTLAQALSSSTPGTSETFNVASLTGAPSGGNWRLVVEGEVVKVTATNPGASPPTVTGLRGSEGTTAAAHNNGTTITEVLTAGALDAFAADTLARIAVSAPLTVTLDGSGNPTLAIPAATGSVDGYMTASQASKLAAIAASAQVNVLESVSGTAPIVVAAVSGKNQAISINPASGVTAGSMSIAHYNDLANATSAKTGDKVAKRDSNGDVAFRYVTGDYLKQINDDNVGSTPTRLMGMTGAPDGFLKTVNPAAITVGYASALAAGADRTKLDGIINTGLSQGDFVGGWLLGGDKWWVYAATVGTVPASPTWSNFATLTLPTGVTLSGTSFIIAEFIGVGSSDSMHRIKVAARAVSGHTDQVQIIAGSIDGTTNLSALISGSTVYLRVLVIAA